MARKSPARTTPAIAARRSPPVNTAKRRPAIEFERKTPAATTATRSPAAQSTASTPASGGFTALLESAAKEILPITYWFDPAPNPEPYPVTVRFSGHRTDVEGKREARDEFLLDETIEKVIPGSGPLSLTAKVHDINPGKWAVTARVLESPRNGPGPREPGKEIPAGGTRLSAARLWSHWAQIAGEHDHDHLKTCLPPFAKAPGVIPGIWGVLVTLGIAVALAMQFLVIDLAHLNLSLAWLITVVGTAVGIAGAKLWFIVLHRRERRIEGWCIQGFITGAVATATLLLVLLHVPAAAFLDATAPGLLVAMAIGRFGCFLAGCCGGPPTAARWGVWSSDQRVGARRVPTQLMESLLALVLGLAALVAVLVHGPADGAFFVTALAAYTLGRQLILRMRAEVSKKWMEALVTVGLLALVLVVEFVFTAH